MGLPTILKMACTAQEEEHRQDRMGEPCPGARLPSQNRSGSTQQGTLVQLGMLLDKAVPWGQPTFGQCQHPFLEC